MMSQSEINAEIDQYLHLVRKKLSMLPDAEAIVSELRSHIWDSANKYATRDNIPIEQAFRKALDQMEDPEILANRFYEESGYQYATPDASTSTSSNPSPYSGSHFSQNFQQKSVIPEKKLEQDKFFLIALLGFIATMIIGGTLVATINDPVISVLGSLLQVGAFGIFIAYLYYRDDQTFQDQIARLREKFEKAHAEHLENQNRRMSIRERRQQKRELRRIKREEQKNTPLNAFFVHFGAFLGAISMVVVLMALFYVTYLRPEAQYFFNDYWYSIGFVVFSIMLGTQLVYFVSEAVLGQVRGLRMVDAIINFIGAIGMFILIVYYPFTIGHGILQLAGTKITDPQVIAFLSTKLDYYLRIIFGFVVIINFMKSIYSVFKFETWKPKDTISLLNV